VARIVERESHVDHVGDVVVITHTGAINFDDAHNAIGIGLTSAQKAAGKKLLFDLRLADLSNYYSFIVRHAELAPGMGLDASFLVAFVGTREAADVLSFTERVVRNRGWNARHFFSMDEALEWLAKDDPTTTNGTSKE
jgi:hypothetical protein